MCGTSKATDKAAADQKNFTNTLMSQGAQVFGADNSVFNSMMKSYGPTVAAGPSQQGWSQAETNAVNAQIVNQAAVANRNIAAAVGNNLAAVGGGNVSGGTSAGSTAALEASIAENTEAQKSSALNLATQQNYQQGVHNYEFAAGGMQAAPGVYSNMPKMNEATQAGLDRNMANAQAADAASNWWVKPVEGIAAAGVNMLVPGLGSGILAGMNQKSGPASTPNQSDMSWATVGAPSNED